MKALTLTQPWASLVANGHKRVETRSWRTAYIGPLAIHAAQGFPPQARQCLRRPAFSRALWDLDDPPYSLYAGDTLPRGVVVAVVNLVRCVPVEDVVLRLGAEELTFGDYSPGRWAWVLQLVDALKEPVPARGSLGLWEWAA